MNTYKSLKNQVNKVNKRQFTTTLKNFIGGNFHESKATKFYETIDPATQKVISRVPETTNEEFEMVVKNSHEAFKSWRNVPLLTRQRYVADIAHLFRQNAKEIGKVIAMEHGKTVPDAIGEVQRGLEAIDQASNIAPLYFGETLENVSSHMDTYSYRSPLGVVSAIAPFNFPFMVPVWAFPYALACGNSVILKPSEKVANTSDLIARLVQEAKLPAGVFNVVHGGHQQVRNICTHKDIKAISFVGGNSAGEYIYDVGSKHGKRVQSNMAAKNHAIILPDCDKEEALNGLVGASIGAGGQRCMAISVAVFVGKSKEWLGDLAAKMNQIKIGYGLDEGTDLGPVVDKKSKERILGILNAHEKEGGKFLVDGRHYVNDKYPQGNFLGPSLLTNCTVKSTAYVQEIFGPALVVLEADTMDEAIELINNNRYGNGVSIFTKSGANARRFQREIECGQIGINVPIPVPVPCFSFTGNKDSIRGDINFLGRGGVNFYTQWKTITSRWKPEGEESQKLQMSFPVLK